MKKSKLQFRGLLIMISIIAMFTDLQAQEKINTKLLTGKEWVMQSPSEKKGISYRVKFTLDEQISLVIVGDQTVELKCPYYLSDEIPQKFDAQKVGLPGTGKYIITCNKVRNAKKENCLEMDVFEILKLTKTEMQIKSLETNLITDYKVKESDPSED